MLLPFCKIHAERHGYEVCIIIIFRLKVSVVFKLLRNQNNLFNFVHVLVVSTRSRNFTKFVLTVLFRYNFVGFRVTLGVGIRVK